VGGEKEGREEEFRIQKTEFRRQKRKKRREAEKNPDLSGNIQPMASNGKSPPIVENCTKAPL